MSLIEEYSIDYSFNCLVKRSILEYDVRGLSTEFESDFLIGTCNSTLNDLSNFCRSCECDLVYIRMIHQCRTCFACSGDDVHHTRRKSRFFDDLCKLESGKRCSLCGFEH